MNKLNYNLVALAVLIILNIVGIVGLNMASSRAYFESIAHINISISLVLVLFADDWKSPKLYTFFAIAFVTGMLLEIVGVQTGIIFGKYHYTDTFGLTIIGVPVVIGFNWFLLTVCVLNLIKIRNDFLRAILGGIAMTATDFILEPFAIKHGFWVWDISGTPPFQNYFAWFIISSVLSLVYIKLQMGSLNRLAVYYLLILVLFLLIDNFIG